MSGPVSDSARRHNELLLRRLYDALEAGDPAPISSLLAQTIVVHIADGTFAGTYTGASEVADMYASVIRAMGAGFKVPEYDLLVHDESLVVFPVGTAGAQGASGFDIYHFAHGLITEAWLTVWRA
jgi:hypothetical protein